MRMPTAGFLFCCSCIHTPDFMALKFGLLDETAAGRETYHIRNRIPDRSINEDYDMKRVNERLLKNTLWIAFTELFLMQGGMFIMRTVVVLLMKFFHLDEYLYELLWLLLFLIPSSLIIGYMRLTRPESLSVFCMNQRKRSLKAFGIGLLIGLVLNGGISIILGLTGTVQYSVQGFTAGLLLIFVPVIIQCTCEELFLRGYVPAYMEPESHWSMTAFVSGMLFIFHHTSNLTSYGFSSSFCLNVFLIGVFEYLLVKRNGNFWIVAGFHTAWNYTQQFLFGLPNSGTSSPIAILIGQNAKNNFFFNTVYGNEGSLLTTVILIVLILVLIRQGKGISEPAEKQA